jgi:hypothetical protein
MMCGGGYLCLLLDRNGVVRESVSLAPGPIEAIILSARVHAARFEMCGFELWTAHRLLYRELDGAEQALPEPAQDY